MYPAPIIEIRFNSMIEIQCFNSMTTIYMYYYLGKIEQFLIQRVVLLSSGAFTIEILATISCLLAVMVEGN